MNLRGKRAIAARIFRCGVYRVWIDPEGLTEVKQAITKADIRRLISLRVIQKRPTMSTSTSRAKHLASQKRKGRRSGPGSREGRKFARSPRKRLWVARIRALRSELRAMKESKDIDRRTYRKLYYMADSGFFRSRAHLRIYVKQAKRGATTPEVRR